MRVIRWLDSAELDLTNIIRYIEVTFGTSTASQVFDDIMLRVVALGQFPYLGTCRITVFCKSKSSLKTPKKKSL